MDSQCRGDSLRPAVQSFMPFPRLSIPERVPHSSCSLSTYLFTPFWWVFPFQQSFSCGFPLRNRPHLSLLSVQSISPLLQQAFSPSRKILSCSPFFPFIAFQLFCVLGPYNQSLSVRMGCLPPPPFPGSWLPSPGRRVFFVFLVFSGWFQNIPPIHSAPVQGLS